MDAAAHGPKQVGRTNPPNYPGRNKESVAAGVREPIWKMGKPRDRKRAHGLMRSSVNVRARADVGAISGS